MSRELYDSKSDLAKKVCDAIGWTFSVSPIKVFGRGKKIYATGTLLHPDEWRKLIACEGRTIEGKQLIITRRPKGY